MSARKWTPEQRQRQSELIRTWEPWSQSTGPQSVSGKRIASRNADKGGMRPALRSLAKNVSEMLRVQREALLQV